MWKKQFADLLFSSDPSKIDTKKAMSLKYEQMPPYLYKYKSFDNDHSLDIIKTDNIRLSNPTQFNDPFDSSMKSIMDDVGDDDFKRSFLNQKPNKLKQKWGISQKNLNKLKKSDNFVYDLCLIIAKNEFTKGEIGTISFEEVASGIKSQFMKMNIITQEMWKKELFVSCFSERNESILMWSHYSKNHEGFCVQYDFSEIDYNDYRNRFIFPVIYTKSILNVSNYIFQMDNKFKNVLKSFAEGLSYNDTILRFNGSNMNNMFLFYASLNKFKDWEYEKEWRFIYPFENHEKHCYLKMPKPKAIYLGSLIDEKNRESILKIGKERNIPIYQMYLRQFEFALDSKLVQK